ncbi:MAG TPA: uracil phosphoribosyltransferase [Chitinophagales bacterium]|nr:uracil phosphoribosyltransferase [Chitinophagales bacterium]
MVINLGDTHSLINQFVAEIRDVNIQHDRMRFRRNLERVGEIAAYEISKTLAWKTKTVTTPLGTKEVPVLAEQPVIGTILRAGLPLHQGLLHYFDGADNAFISAYRKHAPDGSFDISLEYLASASIADKVLIIADPMLATGSSMVKTLLAVYKEQRPKHTHLVCVIASKPGIELIQRNLTNFTLWTAAIDDTLNDHAYIVPGLGDAGDLAFGDKIQY